ncbi:MAG: YCF48-related protein [Ignavibacteria bacterium]|nr:YCF48-related protein [Ignavibacteria bacterium]
MKKVSFLLITLFITDICLSQTQWYLINSPVSSNLNKIIFINQEPQIGYIAGDSGVVLKSTNNGLNWSKKIVNRCINFTEIEFLNSQTGWIVGASNCGVFIYKTTNGGAQWNDIYEEADTIRCPTGLHFNNGQNGFITAGNRNSSSPTRGYILRTSNGGMNWTKESGSTSVQGISFMNADYGWMTTRFNIGNYYSEINLTTNAGINWDMRINSDACDFTAIYTKSLSKSWAFSKFVYNQSPCVEMYKWDGNIWLGSWMTNGNYIYTSVSFYDSINGFVCTDHGHIYKTTNGGISFTSQYPVILTYLRSIIMISKDIGFAAGNGGRIFTNSISVGIISDENDMPRSYSLKQNYPNPFNPVTKIRFDIPKDSRILGNDKVLLKVFDMLGREIKTLVNESLKPGSYETTFDGSNLNSGVYFYQLLINNKQLAIKKMILLK